MTTPNDRERTNRILVLLAAFMLCGAALYAYWAWGFWSWRALGFAACAAMAVMSAACSVLLFG